MGSSQLISAIFLALNNAGIIADIFLFCDITIKTNKMELSKIIKIWNQNNKWAIYDKVFN